MVGVEFRVWQERRSERYRDLVTQDFVNHSKASAFPLARALSQGERNTTEVLKEELWKGRQKKGDQSRMITEIQVMDEEGGSENSEEGLDLLALCIPLFIVQYHLMNS